MIVCLCRSVSDSVIREHIQSGISTLAGLVRSCGAGTGERCGACHCDLRRMLSQANGAEAVSCESSDLSALWNAG